MRGVHRQQSGIIELVGRALVPAACLLVLFYFATHALFGDAGYFALDEIRQQQHALTAEQGALQAKKGRLQREIRLLDPAGVDPDFADELVRRHLGVLRPDEVMVPLVPPPAAGKPATGEGG